MESVSLPNALLNDWIVEVAVFVDDEVALASFLSHLGLVSTHEELSFEQLDANYSKHELKKESDQDNVADGFYSDDDALNHMFQTLSSVDGSERTEYT